MWINNKGQSTVELALLLPILFFLFYITITAFGVNHRASQKSVEKHADDLKKFDHGNGVITIDGVDLPPGSFTALIPSGPSITLPAILGPIAASTLARLGLNELMSNLSFLDGKTYLSGALRGGIYAGANSYISSGFKGIDADAMKWGAIAGAFSSKDATEDFQGKDFGKSSLKEFVGSGAQNSIIGYAQGGGDLASGVAGGVSGLLNSDTSKQWLATGNDILKGAAKGAIESSLSGLVAGKFDTKQVLIATGLGAFNTNSVAKALPFTNWSGGDARQSASFGAMNSALSTLVRGGNLKDTFFSATSGAFFSSQSMRSIAGDSQIVAGAAGAAYGAGISYLQGEHGAAVGLGALQSFGLTMMAHQQLQFQKELGKVFQDVTNPQEALRNLPNDQLIDSVIVPATLEKLEDADVTNAIATAITTFESNYGPIYGPWGAREKTAQTLSVTPLANVDRKSVV